MLGWTLRAAQTAGFLGGVPKNSACQTVIVCGTLRINDSLQSSDKNLNDLCPSYFVQQSRNLHTFVFIYVAYKEAVSGLDGAMLNGRMIDGRRNGVEGSAGGLVRYTGAAVALTE